MVDIKRGEAPKPVTTEIQATTQQPPREKTGLGEKAKNLVAALRRRLPGGDQPIPARDTLHQLATDIGTIQRSDLPTREKKAQINARYTQGASTEGEHTTSAQPESPLYTLANDILAIMGSDLPSEEKNTRMRERYAQEDHRELSASSAAAEQYNTSRLTKLADRLARFSGKYSMAIGSLIPLTVGINAVIQHQSHLVANGSFGTAAFFGAVGAYVINEYRKGDQAQAELDRQQAIAEPA